MKFLIKLFLVVSILLIISGILILGYYGLIPGVSTLFASNKPRDLGITYSEQDLTNALEKGALKSEALSATKTPSESIKYSGQMSIQNTFSDKEITALVNSRNWIYYPISNTQVKFNPDGTGEVSATLLKDRIAGYTQAFGLTQEGLAIVMDKLKLIPVNPPIYAKGKFEVKNNQLTLVDIQKIEIGRFSIPTNLINDNKKYLIAAAEERIKSTPGCQINAATINNGKLYFDGTLPEKELVVQE